jgi:hypothetical protein
MPASALIYDGNVTPNVFFTDGVNGSWTIDRANGIELGLRAKARWPTASNTFNSNGDGTYSHFAGTHLLNPGGVFPTRALWNYEFTANVDFDGTSGMKLYDGLSDPTPTDVQVLLAIDTDPSTCCGVLRLRRRVLVFKQPAARQRYHRAEFAEHWNATHASFSLRFQPAWHLRLPADSL